MCTRSPSTTTALGRILIDGVISSSEKKLSKNGSIQWNILTLSTFKCWESSVFETHLLDSHLGMTSMRRYSLAAKSNSWNGSSLWVFTLQKDAHSVAVVGPTCSGMQHKYVVTVKGDVSWFVKIYVNGCWIVFAINNLEILVVFVEVDMQTTDLLWCTACGHNFITLSHNVGLYF